jgi:multimeric flavodoxin WrbA
MKKLEVSVIYQSLHGHTEVIAKAIQQGVTEVNESKANLIKVNNEGKISEIDWQILKRSQAIIFGAPTYMGSLPGAFKFFMDYSFFD